ncbi:hypothetical protein THASP1DRAFT_30490 [Thamnocephalis sphaerospora]|uniref:Inositol-1-monophosphatase n=1 Tax=Thamnocephalis sphaerospora TaxID=78915 RepID=A0A4P9XNY6_9FUNG|nr:hypothetical protein THASP1DRAFT_30490 [Thamnocephalis sphaerospora]|eukprot:RKP07694.1 hypothetical protein THASP1DRAFT_30490 [Thamnocephalis sphaerospora]
MVATPLTKEQTLVLRSYCDFAVELAQEAGATIREAFRQRHGYPLATGTAVVTSSADSCDASEIDIKDGNSADLVTAADRAVERRLRERIAARFPAHSCVGEEFGAEGGQGVQLGREPTWIMDPIGEPTRCSAPSPIHNADDSACIFGGEPVVFRRFPFVAVSIGVVVDGELAVGVVFNPILGELYTAVRGDGAYLNRTARLPLHSRPLASRLADCLVGVEFGAMRDAATLPAKSRSIQRLAAAGQGHCHGVRCTGSAALNLCLVARGALDLYWEIGIHCWDVAAGALIVQEASGGSVWHGAGWHAPLDDDALAAPVAPTSKVPTAFHLLQRKVLAIRGHGGSTHVPAHAHQLAAEALSLVEDLDQESD